jgi:hypothetical protein
VVHVKTLLSLENIGLARPFFTIKSNFIGIVNIQKSNKQGSGTGLFLLPAVIYEECEECEVRRVSDLELIVDNPS